MAATYLSPLLYGFSLSGNAESVPTATAAIDPSTSDALSLFGEWLHPSRGFPGQKVFHHHPIHTSIVIRFAFNRHQKLAARSCPHSPTQDSLSIIKLLSDTTTRIPKGAIYNTLHSRVIAILATKRDPTSNQADPNVAWLIKALSSTIKRESPALLHTSTEPRRRRLIYVEPDASRTTVINQGILPT
ncbi:hypothetical protein LY78DRAFT_682015 [Colletotrichum sublineola]|nr:hypothetical protein LY78DRAFT_682015 [Colletotrichum sublineola]